MHFFWKPASAFFLLFMTYVVSQLIFPDIHSKI